MANYKGYLIAFNKNIFPNKCIAEYSTTPNQRMEVSAERDNNGDLQRKTLSNHKTNITFSTHILFLDDKIKIQNIINKGIVNSNQRKCKVEYWNDEENKYKEGYFYIPNVEFSVMDASSNDIQYNPITFELIEY